MNIERLVNYYRNTNNRKKHSQTNEEFHEKLSNRMSLFMLFVVHKAFLECVIICYFIRCGISGGKILKKKIDYDVLHPTYKALSDLVGEDNMMEIYREFRGTQLQLPMKLYDRKELEEYLGSLNEQLVDVLELSRKYGFSQRWIKKSIINDKK